MALISFGDTIFLLELAFNNNINNCDVSMKNNLTIAGISSKCCSLDIGICVMNTLST